MGFPVFAVFWGDGFGHVLVIFGGKVFGFGVFFHTGESFRPFLRYFSRVW